MNNFCLLYISQESLKKCWASWPSDDKFYVSITLKFFLGNHQIKNFLKTHIVLKGGHKN